MTDVVAVKKPTPKFVEAVDIRFDASLKAYYVSVNTDEFIRGKHENDLFLVWLLSRWEDETIVFSFNQSTWGAPPENYITFLNAIKICSAKTYARVDHMHEGTITLAALACDELVVSDFGMLQIDPIVGKDGSTKLGNQLEAASDFAFYLMERAVSNGVLTQEEYASIRDGSVVVITPDALKERVG